MWQRSELVTASWRAIWKIRLPVTLNTVHQRSSNIWSKPVFTTHFVLSVAFSLSSLILSSNSFRSPLEQLLCSKDLLTASYGTIYPKMKMVQFLKIVIILHLSFLLFFSACSMSSELFLKIVSLSYSPAYSWVKIRATRGQAFIPYPNSSSTISVIFYVEVLFLQYLFYFLFSITTPI